MDDNDFTRTIRPSALIQIKNRAFDANFRAKLSEGEQREAFYRMKHAAINYLLEIGAAFVKDVNWCPRDPVLSVQFIGGGKLHAPLSSLDRGAFRSVRRQLNDGILPAA